MTGVGGGLVTGVLGDDTLTLGADTLTVGPDTLMLGVETSTPGTDALTLGIDASTGGVSGAERIGTDTVISGALVGAMPIGCASASPAVASMAMLATTAPQAQTARVELRSATATHRVVSGAAWSRTRFERWTVVAPLPTDTWTASVRRVISANPLPLSARALVFGAQPTNVP